MAECVRKSIKTQSNWCILEIILHDCACFIKCFLSTFKTNASVSWDTFHFLNFHLSLFTYYRVQITVWSACISKMDPTVWRNALMVCREQTASSSNMLRPTTSAIPATPTAPRGKTVCLCLHLNLFVSFFASFNCIKHNMPRALT